MSSAVLPVCGWNESSVQTTSTVSPVAGSVFE